MYPPAVQARFWMKVKPGELGPLRVMPHAGSLVAFLALRAELASVPAATWPLEGALEALRRHAPSGDVVAAALEQMALGPVRPDVRVSGVRALLRGLVLSGKLAPTGAGWDARFELEPQWLGAHASLFELLSAPDQDALDHAAQQLHAMSTIASKKSASPGCAKHLNRRNGYAQAVADAETPADRSQTTLGREDTA